MLAQTVLVQNIALDQAKAQVAQLQQQVQQLQQHPQPAHTTSFLGRLLGEHDQRRAATAAGAGAGLSAGAAVCSAAGADVCPAIRPAAVSAATICSRRRAAELSCAGRCRRRREWLRGRWHLKASNRYCTALGAVATGRAMGWAASAWVSVRRRDHQQQLLRRTRAAALSTANIIFRIKFRIKAEATIRATTMRTTICVDSIRTRATTLRATIKMPALLPMRRTWTIQQLCDQNVRRRLWL